MQGALAFIQFRTIKAAQNGPVCLFSAFICLVYPFFLSMVSSRLETNIMRVIGKHFNNVKVRLVRPRCLLIFQSHFPNRLLLSSLVFPPLLFLLFSFPLLFLLSLFDLFLVLLFSLLTCETLFVITLTKK